MPLNIRDAKELESLTPGMMISFNLVVEKDASHAEGIQVLSYQGLEVDPLTARRLKLLNRATNPAVPGHEPVALGKAIPDFHLLDQDGRPIRLSRFQGKVVALNFVYTRCALPDFCLRTASNFAQLQQRFRNKLGSELVLLTVTFDPAHDQPDVLKKYGSNLKADFRAWHFLTGPIPEVQRVCDLFGVDAFLDEGLMTHSLHTAIIDRKGDLTANIEGNQYTAGELADLVQTVLQLK